MLIICLGFSITITTTCIIYYYCACITIIHIIASFILPLTRSLSDDPGFACPGWRSELPYYQIVPRSHIGDSSSRLFIGILVIYFCYLIYPSVISFIPVFISVMITNLFLQVFLYLFPAGTIMSMEVIPCTEA